MTHTLALLGKGGSGKTTLTRAFALLIREYFPDASVLLVDNDLTCELAGSFGLKSRNTIYGIRSGKHEYKTGIPKGMTKQEYIEWALEDILEEVEENTDIIVSWFVASKDCRCPITKQMNDALVKLIDRYDFVIFDTEFDLKYLNLLVDYPIDTSIITANPNQKSIHLAGEIYEFSKKYAADGQFGVILNKAKKETMNKFVEQINLNNLNLLGVIDDLGEDVSYERLKEIIKDFYPRLNLPQSAQGGC